MDKLINIETFKVTIPDKAIAPLVKTACDTFEILIYPLTATTQGAGHLIKGYFDTLNDIQKIYAAEYIRKAKEKVKRDLDNNYSCSPSIKPIVFYQVFDHINDQIGENQSELMSNVLVNEIKKGDVHPEIVRLISKLTIDDIILLNNIANHQEKLYISRLFSSIRNNNDAALAPDINSFNHNYLSDLGLVTRDDRIWKSTYAGIELLTTISLPD